MFLVRTAVALALLVVGFAGGVAGALVHDSWWGLTLGLVASTMTTLALPPGGWRIAFVFGWVGAVAYVVQPKAEGDYLIPATTAGYGFLVGSFVIFLIALATLPRRGSRRADPDVSGAGT